MSQYPSSPYDFTLHQVIERLSEYLEDTGNYDDDPDTIFCAKEALKDIHCIAEALEMAGF